MLSPHGAYIKRASVSTHKSSKINRSKVLTALLMTNLEALMSARETFKSIFRLL